MRDISSEVGLQATREASYRLVDLVCPLVLECFAPQVSNPPGLTVGDNT